MGNVRLLALSFVAVVASLTAVPQAVASPYMHTADTWPFSLTDRPLTLASGMLEIRGDTLRANLSKSAVGEPISLSPDIYVGLNSMLTVGVIHQVGVCLTPGEENGCPTAYHDVGAEAIYSFMHGGNAQVALRGGLVMPLFSPFTLGVQGGAIARIRGGKVAIVAEPMIYLGLAGRSNDNDGLVTRAREIVDIPGAFQVSVQPQTTAYLTSGFRESLRDFGDTYEIPLGLGVNFALNHRLDLGGEFRLENLLGQNGNFDRRILFLRAALRV
jgi:hypothetical protein